MSPALYWPGRTIEATWLQQVVDIGSFLLQADILWGCGPLLMALAVEHFVKYGIRAVLALACIKILANVIEWLRVQWLLSRLPRGPPRSSLLLGNTGAASKVLIDAIGLCTCAQLQAAQ